MSGISLALVVAAAVALYAIVSLIQLNSAANENRSKLLAIEAELGQEAAPVQWQWKCRGLTAVLVGQWWAYGPLLLLAALANWRFGPGFEMWLMLGAAAFWVISGAGEDVDGY